MLPRLHLSLYYFDSAKYWTSLFSQEFSRNCEYFMSFGISFHVNYATQPTLTDPKKNLRPNPEPNPEPNTTNPDKDV